MQQWQHKTTSYLGQLWGSYAFMNIHTHSRTAAQTEANSSRKPKKYISVCMRKDCGKSMFGSICWRNSKHGGRKDRKTMEEGTTERQLRLKRKSIQGRRLQAQHSAMERKTKWWIKNGSDGKLFNTQRLSNAAHSRVFRLNPVPFWTLFPSEPVPLRNQFPSETSSLLKPVPFWTSSLLKPVTFSTSSLLNPVTF